MLDAERAGIIDKSDTDGSGERRDIGLVEEIVKADEAPK